MLKERVITAAVLLVAFLAILFFANQSIFLFAMALVAAAAAYEWATLSGLASTTTQIASAVVGFIAMLSSAYLLQAGIVFFAICLTALFWLYALHLLRQAPVRMSIRNADWPGFLLGAVLIIVTVLSVQILRFAVPHASPWLLLYALALVWVMDTGAYFIGKRFGRIKLAPKISPGKTREGALGGVAAACSLFLLTLLFTDWPTGTGWAVFFATLIAAPLSIVGDLFESRLKRAAGAKDSSDLLPGHGGVLDRIDGVLATLPVFTAVYLCLTPTA